MQKWYWCGRSTAVVSFDEVIDYGSASAFVEPTVSHRNVGIKIRHLTKVLARRYSRDVC